MGRRGERTRPLRLNASGDNAFAMPVIGISRARVGCVCYCGFADIARVEPMMMQIPVTVGQRLGGRYRVDGALAQGGTSVVLSGTDLEGDRPVAIKVLLPEMAKASSSRSRFEREIRVLRHLQSDCVVKVLDDGSLQTGEPFMVMEQLSGRTLKDALLADGPLPVRTAVDYVLQACEVLAEAHAAGVVHRDVKPENLFLVGEGTTSCIKVLDFGLSTAQSVGGARDAREPSITRGNEVMGSPYYMAPEQMLSSRHVDRSADIWSIGIVLYELLTGRLPFAGETVERLRAHVMMSAPVPMRETRPDIPPELEAIVMRCLEKVPEGRFKGLAVLAASLAPFGTDRAKLSASRVLGAAPSKIPPPLPQTDPPQPLELWTPPGVAAQAEPGLTRVQLDESGPRQVHHVAFNPERTAASYAWTARTAARARRARRTFLMGVSLIFFVLGIAVGVVFSVWEHQRPAPVHASLAR